MNLFPSSLLISRHALLTATFCTIISACGPASAQRLPSSVVPSHYALALTPDLKSATFAGLETIDVEVKEPTSTITLNANQIAIQSVIVSANNASQTATISFDSAKQQAAFTFPSPIGPGKAVLSIRFTGMLNNSLRGFYLSKTDRRNYAVTQFEATDARRAFPCFDEPALKATFDVTLTIDKSDTAIANTSIAEDKPGPGADKHTVRFETTPKMSTYLLAFLVGDFQCTTGEQDGVAIRSCSTPDKVNLTPYSVEFAKFALHYFNNYFGIPYPLKKLDLIALPDFEAGAMENFGAITYRETALLIDEKTASIHAKQTVEGDIAHEIAHQWFGDLVTMQWWDNLWLNEGFANWMENKPVAARHPEWNIDQSVVADLDHNLNIDSGPTTRPIRAKADTPDEINQMFDAIAYGKASDVLLTVENYVGPEAFRQGVHNYLVAHAYGNATAEDFWNIEAAASHKPVDRIMSSLVEQPGVPLLTLGPQSDHQVPVSQHRFFLSPSLPPDPSKKWTVPVCFKTGDQQQCDILTPQATSLEIPPNKVLFANAGGKGYYRTSYTPDQYRALVANVETGLTPAERISLLGDEWAHLRSNHASTGDYLDLVAATSNDPDADLAGSAIDGVEIIYSRVAASDAEKTRLSAWVRRTFQPAYKRLGPPSNHDSANTQELRARLFEVLGIVGEDPEVLAEARTLADTYLSDPASVEPTLRETALAIAARNGDSTLFDRFLHVYETANDPELKTSALHWLAQFQNPALADRALNLAVSSKVRNQDAAGQLGIALQIDPIRPQAWQFIETHWSQVQSQMTVDGGSRLVRYTGAFCSASDRDRVERFFKSHRVEASDVYLRHAIENINGCIELRTLQEPQLRTWLATQPHP